MTLRAALLVAAWLAAARPGARGDPQFDPATLMRLVLVPADAAVGSVVYRVRASDPDFDYPLQFELVGQMGRLDIAIESLPCTRYNSVCQANVILLRRLEPGRYVDFRLSVRNTRGRSKNIACSVTGTNATTPRDAIFPHQPGIILVPEDAKRGSDLDIIIARKNPMSSKPLELELWGSPLFAIRQRRLSTDNTEGTIFLLGPLDFETQSMYHLTLFAVEPYVEIGKDTRNIAGLEVVVVVQDVQDMPPVFTHAPPITHLAKQLVPGDIVLRVRAEDGDKGAPRQIRYGLVSEGNPFTPFFNINETTGELSLAAGGALAEMTAISHAGAPVLLTVVAEEVRRSREEPEAMSTTVQLAFILPERDNTPPYFENNFYITYLDENSPQGTALVFAEPYMPLVSDGDSGRGGAFSLALAGNNGTFEVSPAVAERRAQFIVRVRDNVMLDYEARKSVVFQIVAQELSTTTNLSAVANVTVYLNDVNDNAPVFLELSYDVELAENVTAGTRVTQVAAEDVDTGIFGKIQFTAILGYLNTSLHLDPMTGIVTVATSNHGFDREAMPELHFLVEARDMDGVGLRETVPLVIKLLDVNDNQPQFERSLYEFVLSPSMSNFTSTAFIKAVDKDAEPPNNVVRYELIHGNTDAKFSVNEESGELFLLEPIKRYQQDAKRHKRQFESEEESEVYVLTARAYDLGVPRLFSTTIIKVYPPESKTKTMSFIVPGANPDRRKLEEILSTLSGGKVTILDVRPYKGNDAGLPDVSSGNSQEKSVVVALVRQTGNTAINIAKLQEQLAKNQTIISSSADHSGTSQDSDSNNFSGIYKAENRLLFWMFILLAIIIAIVLLSLICCCICEGCPLYMPPRKRVIRVNSTEDDVHLVVQDKGIGNQNKSTQHLQNKPVQSEWTRREAWSAEQADLRTKPTQWKFNKRNYRSREPSKPSSTPGDLRQEYVMPAAAARDLKYDGRQSMRMRDGPNIIFTKEMQLQEAFANKHREYIEDLENGYDRIATLHYQRRDPDNDSIRRHEMERGSQVYLKSDIDKEFDAKPHDPSSLGRDQFFIKEGNTEILRLVTRGNEEERYVNLPPPQRPVTLIPQTQYVVVDSGKDLLMQRFIREQGEEAKYLRDRMSKVDLEHMHVSDERDQPKSFVNSQAGSDGKNYTQEYLQPEVPGIIPIKVEHLQSKSTLHQDLLESSLRKQNELLHQILLERERVQNETASQFDSKLETQSLPGHSVIATQTDCHMSTQTEPQLLKPSRRKARSDNDSYSEDETNVTLEDEIRQIAWVKRKKPRKKIKYKEYNPRKSIRVYDVKRKIRTPILEENEVSPSCESEKHIKVSKTNQREEHTKNYGDSKKSVVKTSKHETISSTEIKLSDTECKSALQREVLMEISDSLDDQAESSSSIKARRSKLRRQITVAESYDEETEEYQRRNTNTKDQITVNETKNSTGFTSNDSRNLVFSRQGSSTETRELAENQVQKILNKEDLETVVEKNDSSSSTDSRGASSQIITKLKEEKTSESEETTKASEAIKTTTKSIPRYMQWYSKKTAPVTKPPAKGKIIPSKPKRLSKIKKEPEKNAQDIERAAHYGKLVTKDPSDTLDVKKNAKLKEKDYKIHPRLLKEEKVTPVPEGPLPDVHPLLQHSEHRYEHQYENQNPLCYIQPTHMPQYLGMHPTPPVLAQRQSVTQQPIYVNQDQLPKIDPNKISEGALTHSISISTSYEEEKPTEVHISKVNIGSGGNQDSNRSTSKVEDDDSGIAMSSLIQQTGNVKRFPITEKKSIFTIAYDDVHTKQLRPDSSSTSY